MTKDLEGKIIAITSAASGIGLACAQPYLRGGALLGTRKKLPKPWPSC